MPGYLIIRACAAAVMAATLGACSSDISLSQINLVPKFDNPFSNNSALSFRGGAGDLGPRQVTGEDLVSADGQCAVPQAVASAQAEGTPPADAAATDGATLVRGGIALQMTECEVVSRAGVTDKVVIGANERNERAVTLTYTTGPWPGIYRFAEGRLVSIERVAEPAKPAKAKAKARPKAAKNRA